MANRRSRPSGSAADVEDREVLAGPVSVERPASLLVERARTYLREGPARSVPLMEHVCQLPGAPEAVAEQLALALFSGASDVVRGPDGYWSLAVRERARPGRDRRATPSRPLDSLTFVVVDVETTGNSPLDGDRITEFGAVTVTGGRIVDTFESLVNPERPIPPYVSALTRISWEMVRSAPTFRDLAPRVAAVLEGRLFVAHNAAFDWRFVSREMSRFGGRELTGERLCTVRLARALVPEVRRRSLDSLSFHYGIENHARHRAGGDALATARVLLRLLDVARDRGCRSLEDLRALTRRVPARGRKRRRRGLPGWSDGELTA